MALKNHNLVLETKRVFLRASNFQHKMSFSTGNIQQVNSEKSMDESR